MAGLIILHTYSLIRPPYSTHITRLIKLPYSVLLIAGKIRLLYDTDITSIIRLMGESKTLIRQSRHHK